MAFGSALLLSGSRHYRRMQLRRRRALNGSPEGAAALKKFLKKQK